MLRCRSSKHFATVAAALVSLLAAFGPVTASAQATPSSPLGWQTCAPPAEGFQCATLQVPLDYGDPGVAPISLALIRHQATDPAHRVGSLLWNPGGPGGSGVAGLPELYSYFPAAVRARFDIVSFDPRGIGGSNQLRCFSSPDQENALLAQLPPAGFPVGQAQTQTEINVWAQFDQACAAHGGPIQDHMDTADVARDMDQIRAALGEAKLDYYGISYGTYLGDVYANLFPSHVGHFVLDGNVAPVQWNDAVGGSVRDVHPNPVATRERGGAADVPRGLRVGHRTGMRVLGWDAAGDGAQIRTTAGAAPDLTSGGRRTEL